MFKFEKLEVWELSLAYIDMIYAIANRLPDVEKFNLNSQIIRAASSIALNIAEGSTGQSNAEQKRFLSIALRSLIETIACMKLIERRQYTQKGDLKNIYAFSEKSFAKLTAFRKTLSQND